MSNRDDDQAAKKKSTDTKSDWNSLPDDIKNKIIESHKYDDAACQPFQFPDAPKSGTGFAAPCIGEVWPKGTKVIRRPDGRITLVAPDTEEAEE